MCPHGLCLYRMGWHILKMVKCLGDIEVVEVVERWDLTSYYSLVGLCGGTVRLRCVVGSVRRL